ncbi:Retrovirus-related Pol polyprotein from transposon TNT 1-94 [Bienertia sinuspersici]
MAEILKLHPATTLPTSRLIFRSLLIMRERNITIGPHCLNYIACVFDRGRTIRCPIWQNLDDIVHQWIYGIVSNDLLSNILNPDDSAMETWNRLERLFQVNKSARALQYDTQLSNVELENFPSVKEYCTRIKTLADNLRNVGSSISDAQMVLRLLRGLGDDPNYKPFKTSMQHLKPLPDFETVRTMLELEEISNNDDDSVPSEVALASHDSALSGEKRS